ncbi:MAG: hypothetical protein J6S58_07385, partial [Lentisphaeria bacterium]|nr:hypothetical protein [Lentisphaeria bacterium]
MSWKFTGRKTVFLILSFLVILGIGAGIWVFKRKGKSSGGKSVESSKAPDRIYPVKRGNMVIGIMLKGSVNAKIKHKLALQAPFATKLIKVVDENSRVKKGDVVAEFETADLLLKVEDYKLSIEQTKKDLDIALEERAVLLSTNREELRTALDKVTECQDAYSRYVRLEGPRDRDTQTLAVSDAEKELSEAKDAYNEAKNTYDNSIFADSAAEETAKEDVEKALQKVTSAETKLNSA